MSGKQQILVEKMALPSPLPSPASGRGRAGVGAGSRSPALYIAVALSFIVVAALAHVWMRLQVIQAGYDLSRETKSHHDLVEQNGKLRLELAVRKDPSVVERRARQELGMAPPEPSQIRILTP